MPDFRLRADRQETYRIVEEVFAQTRILRRQLELELGRWSFVVFGPHSQEGTVVREGCAVHFRVDNVLVYLATVGNPEDVGIRGMPIEEFARGDIPHELKDLDIYQIDPVRPLKIYDKRSMPLSDHIQDDILGQFAGRNIAIIETPDEKYWSLSVLKYLWECDRFFPDVLTEAIKKGGLPLHSC